MSFNLGHQLSPRNKMCNIFKWLFFFLIFKWKSTKIKTTTKNTFLIRSFLDIIEGAAMNHWRTLILQCIMYKWKVYKQLLIVQIKLWFVLPCHPPAVVPAQSHQAWNLSESPQIAKHVPHQGSTPCYTTTQNSHYTVYSIRLGLAHEK